MKSFHLEIIGADKVLCSCEVYSLKIPLSDGLYGIMSGHSPVTAALAEGKITYSTDDGEQSISIKSGVLTFADNRALIVLEQTTVSPV